MKTVWKFPIEVTDTQNIKMPKGASILHVNTQQGTPCIWAEVDSDAPEQQRRFAIYGTGHPIQDVEQKYVGTFMINAGFLVFHVYELLSY